MVMMILMPCFSNEQLGSGNPLAFLCNLSFTEGILPEQLNTANMIPLYIADDPMQSNNYIPVSLLCVLSKVFEKVRYSRLISFLNKFSILYENQYGFRKCHSPHMALLTLMDKLVNAIEKGECNGCISWLLKGLRYRKPFYSSGQTLSLWESWLCSQVVEKLFNQQNRAQFVIYNSTVSDHRKIKCGGLQGSILGPLPSVCSSPLPILFVDDTNLFLSDSDPTCIENRMNDDLKENVMWLKVNKLSLNIKGHISWYPPTKNIWQKQTQSRFGRQN